jgi:hypothetical protein
LESVLEPRELPISVHVSKDQLHSRRSQFCSRVRELNHQNITIVDSNREKPFYLEGDKIAEITNYFFHKLIGKSSETHLVDLIHTYSVRGKNGLDKGVSQRAEQMAAQSETPDALRILYGKFSRTQVASKRDDKVSGILKAKADLAFIDEYDHLSRRVAEKDPTLLNYLKATKEDRAPGVGTSSLLIDRVVNDLGIERSKFSNVVQGVRGIQQFTSFFGEGILALLPLATQKG